MSETPISWLNPGDQLPAEPVCVGCGVALGEPYGWCSGCRMAFCFACGRRHFCTPACPANGCRAGLCVRLVRNGKLSDQWGLPDEGGQAARRQERLLADSR